MPGSPSAPRQPKLNPINIPDVVAQAINYDTQGYIASDADFAARFPGLVQARDTTIEDAYKQLTGPLDPTVQNVFEKQGLAKSLGAFGGGNPAPSVGQVGSASGNTVAASIANSVMQKQDYDRSYFQSLLSSNPERAFGLSGSDVANLAIANTGTLNANNTIAYNNQINSANASAAAGVQTGQLISGIGSTIGGIAGIFNNSNYLNGAYSWYNNGRINATAYSDERLKENIIGIGISSSGLPMVTFNYKGIPNKRFCGVIAQDAKLVFPNAVIERNGWLLVDYDLIDVGFMEI
jgi:hypothetical protein